MKQAIIVLLATFALGATCVPTPAGPCPTYETRCRRNVVEICDASETWQVVMDCDTVEGEGTPWQCCPVDEPGLGIIHSCLPQGSCNGKAE